MKAGRFRCSATMSNLYFPKSGSRFCAKIRVSMEGLVNGRPIRAHPSAKKPMSNSALWAARGRSPTQSKKAFSASSWLGASATMESVMPVSSTMFRGMGRGGLTKVLY